MTQEKPRDPSELSLERPRWAQGWRRLAFPGVFLVYLLQTVQGIHRHVDGAAAVMGYIALALFAIGYMIAHPATWAGERRAFWWIYAAMLALVALEVPLAHQDAFIMLVYIVVLSIAALRRWAIPVVGALVVFVTLLPPAIPSWNAGVDFNDGFTVALVAVAMFGFFAIIRSNRALVDARAEVARLAAENERNRIARDLHDLLGHSLTAITVKAALAKRLSERDREAATREIGEVEELSRAALADVRAAVNGYRAITLAGELAAGAELLRTVGITALVPPTARRVQTDHDELLGWAVREGITNVVKHATASQCKISVGPDWLEIVDDGRSGGGDGAGTGLAGLRQRVSAVGGSVEAGQMFAGGWRLRVNLATAAGRADGQPPMQES
jgi:two-component system, NarL family, sensor histidine kinase DesK